MSFRIIEAPQRSAEWFQARLGRITGSRADAILAKVKSGEAAKRRDYRIDLVVERLTGRTSESTYVSPEMERGMLLEPAAFAAYEAVTGEVVRRSGFLQHDDLMAGCSVDGHVGEGLLELKCPKSAIHFEYLQGARVPPEYAPQCRHNLWISGAPWIDFASFDDRFPDDLALFVVRLTREEAALAEYEVEAVKFLGEVARDLDAVEALRKARRAA